MTKPSIATPVGTTVQGATFVAGGLGAVKGLRVAGVSAGFRRNPERKDLALIVAEHPATVAAVFTQSNFCAAPVTVSRAHLAASKATGARAVILNSGNANAATGEPGLQTALATAQLVAAQLGCEPHQVLVASTGVIGQTLSLERFETGVPQAVQALGAADGTAHAAGLAAAQAIMTTDTVPKQAAVVFTAPQADGSEIAYTLGGIAKGSGMIQPNMATLLGVLATDAPLEQAAAQRALGQAMQTSFNKVTIDSDTSTNDSIFLLATGAAGATGAAAATAATGATDGAVITEESPTFSLFQTALRVLAEDLARQIAYDGEGATKLVTVNVTGAASVADADVAARSVANSPLVKTAVAGHDANWGRVAMALGKSGARFAQRDVDIAIMGLPVCARGLNQPFDEAEALRRFEEYAEIVIDIDLGAGTEATRIWTCDLTHGYVSINGDYRT